MSLEMIRYGFLLENIQKVLLYYPNILYNTRVEKKGRTYVYLKALRVNQWIKNFIVLICFIFQLLLFCLYLGNRRSETYIPNWLPSFADFYHFGDITEMILDAMPLLKQHVLKLAHLVHIAAICTKPVHILLFQILKSWILTYKAACCGLFLSRPTQRFTVIYLCITFETPSLLCFTF